uniref:Uncharacterized protein n=1 Tax=Glossina morsitans morsitans TaxID=37546 RepID=A0A1B0G789_GLOMM
MLMQPLTNNKTKRVNGERQAQTERSRMTDGWAGESEWARVSGSAGKGEGEGQKERQRDTVTERARQGKN